MTEWKTPREYRELAKVASARAELIEDLALRAICLQLASSYEQLALSIEQLRALEAKPRGRMVH